MLSGQESVAFALATMVTNGDTVQVNEWQNANIRSANFGMPVASAKVVPVQFNGYGKLGAGEEMPIFEWLSNYVPEYGDLATEMADAKWYVAVGKGKFGMMDPNVVSPEQIGSLRYNSIQTGVSYPVFRNNFIGFSSGSWDYPLIHTHIRNEWSDALFYFYTFSGVMMIYKE